MLELEKKFKKFRWELHKFSGVGAVLCGELNMKISYSGQIRVRCAPLAKIIDLLYLGPFFLDLPLQVPVQFSLRMKSGMFEVMLYIPGNKVFRRRLWHDKAIENMNKSCSTSTGSVISTWSLSEVSGNKRILDLKEFLKGSIRSRRDSLASLA